MAGPIFCVILVVDCLFFQFLEWLIPRDQLDLVDDELTDGSTVFDRCVVSLRYRSTETECIADCGTNVLPSALKTLVWSEY